MFFDSVTTQRPGAEFSAYLFQERGRGVSRGGSTLKQGAGQAAERVADIKGRRPL